MHTVSRSDDPVRCNDRPATQMPSGNLQADLPWPHPLRGHRGSSHDSGPTVPSTIYNRIQRSVSEYVESVAFLAILHINIL